MDAPALEVYPAPSHHPTTPALLYPICRTPRHWTFTQHHRTTRSPPKPSGISTASEEFQRRHDEDVEGLPGVLSVVGDIIVYGEGDTEDEAIRDHDIKCRSLMETGVVGVAMVLGKLPVLGRPTIWLTVGQGPTALALGTGGGCLDIFTIIYPFSSLSPSMQLVKAIGR